MISTAKKQKAAADFVEPDGIVIYTDGSCRKTGIGAYAVVCVIDHKIKYEYGSYHPNTTSQRMELNAFLWALDFIYRHTDKNKTAAIYSDSEYCIKGTTEWMPNWKLNTWKGSTGAAVKNKDIWIQIDKIYEVLADRISILWSPGHHGVPGNERVDKIATALSANEPVTLKKSDIF